MNCRRRSRAPTNPIAGFTLLDLMLVVTILAIVTATAVMVVDTDEMALDATARAIAADLYRAQRFAVETKVPVGMDFDTTANTAEFVLEDGTTPAESESVLRGLVGVVADVVDDLVTAKPDADATYEKARIASADFAGTDTVLFQPDGRPVAGGYVQVDLGGTWLRIRVQDATGRITITGP